MSASFVYDAAGYPVFPGSSKKDKVFGPDDLNTMQSVFDACLQECGLARDSESAEALGSAIIRLYTQGQHDPDLIKMMLTGAFKRRRG